MIPLGLSAHDHHAYTEQLKAPHGIRIRAQIRNLDGHVLDSLQGLALDGQVDVDMTTDARRSLSLSVVDPHHTLDIDEDLLYLNRMVHVTYGIYVQAGPGWVDVPVFFGPITKADRDGSTLSIEAQSKELLARSVAWKPRTFRKGQNIVEVIRVLMRDLAGESGHAMDLPSLPYRLKHDVSLARNTHIWGLAWRLARDVDRDLFYDGRGHLVMRKRRSNVVFTFSDGDGLVLSDPQVSTHVEDMRNAVEVSGGTPRTPRGNESGHKPQGPFISERAPDVVVVAPRAHPLSPWNLGRHGSPRYLLEVVKNEHIRTKKTARRIAHNHLDRRLKEAIDVSLDCMPVPHLDPYDEIRVNTDSFSSRFVLRRWSLPLKAKSGQAMTIGYNRNVSVRLRRNHK